MPPEQGHPHPAGAAAQAPVARRHHFLSQCYLKGFAVETKGKHQISVFDGKESKTFTTALDNVALEKDFNRVDIEGLKPDAFENAIAAFEGEIAPALDRIIRSGSIAVENDRIALINLICAFALRNPRTRESIRDAQEQVVKKMAKLMVATPQRWATHVERIKEKHADRPEIAYQDVKQFVERDGYKVLVPTERHIQLEIDTFNRLLPIFLRRNWMLLKASDGSGGFITSDHSVVLMWSDPKMRGGFYGPGFGLPSTQVPVAARLAVVGAFELKPGTVIEIGEAGVAGLNGAQVAYSVRQVYARDQNFRYALQPDEPPREASRLIEDRRFRKPPRQD
jgi:hypothetical protein